MQHWAVDSLWRKQSPVVLKTIFITCVDMWGTCVPSIAEAQAQDAQRGCDCPILGSVQEQPGLVVKALLQQHNDLLNQLELGGKA